MTDLIDFCFNGYPEEVYNFCYANLEDFLSVSSEHNLSMAEYVLYFRFDDFLTYLRCKGIFTS